MMRTERFPSVKQVREGEGEQWSEVVSKKNRTKPKVTTGTARLTQFGDLSGPVDFRIGNMSPNMDSNQVKEVLRKCAVGLGVDNFEILDVRCLTKMENPRSKSWKVSVSTRFRDIMMDPAMYIDGWTHRCMHTRRSEG